MKLTQTFSTGSVSHSDVLNELVAVGGVLQAREKNRVLVGPSRIKSDMTTAQNNP